MEEMGLHLEGEVVKTEDGQPVLPLLTANLPLELEQYRIGTCQGWHFLLVRVSVMSEGKLSLPS